MAEDPHGKILWDAVAGILAGRAKDFLSIATIPTPITGVILSDKLFTATQISLPVWWVVPADFYVVEQDCTERWRRGI
jgi:hypothetical protein